MSKKEFEQRTNPQADGIPEPLMSQGIEKAVSFLFGKLDVIPTSIKELPYISGQEYFVMTVLEQKRLLVIDQAVNGATKNLDHNIDNSEAIHESVSASIDLTVNKICEDTGVVGEKTRSMLIDRAMLDKWARVEAAQSLNSRRAGNLDLEHKEIDPVIESILKEHDPKKWKRSMSKELASALKLGEEGLLVFLQEYMDDFASK